MQVSATQGGLPVSPAAVGSATGAHLRDLDNVFRIADTLTENDKKLAGWDPSGGKINTVAKALATYRQSGGLTGEVTTGFVDAVKRSIVNTGGYPMNPASLMSKMGQSNPLSSETASALFALLGQGGSPAPTQHAQEV